MPSIVTLSSKRTFSTSAAFVAGAIITKTRYKVLCGSHLFEVDVVEGANEGLVIAELELSTPDEPYKRPAWLGKEVTGDPRYYNAQLSINTFDQW